ncbi:23S rRNA methyltransferase [Actinomadura barringtoniae]|uniref:23S rRNA methyltransferase n=1 Tax=Actinomadura barringtoniae TaxID=1427535 RepID=A0A939PUL7_9ACTN|nr:23S rRNA methyltransferase [Actinomadura barringtoniae]
MLADVVELLVCPLCGADLTLKEASLRCPAGHTFDLAKQGYANLLPGNAKPGTADTAEMVAARADFLGTGTFASLADALAERVGVALGGGGAVLDAGAGTGYYLGRVLDRSPGSVGLALDISKFAARRAARAHPRIGAAVADLWRPLPVRGDAVGAILNVFAPRNAAEFHRVLRPGGLLHVVTPSSRHLGTLVSELGLLSVDEEKTDRVDATLGGRFRLESRESLETEATLGHEEIATLVGMGPSAHHVPADELARRIAKLPDRTAVPLSFVLSAFRA